MCDQISANTTGDKTFFGHLDRCRICNAKAANGAQLRPLFDDDRVTKIIAGTMLIKLQDLQDCPRHVCEGCLEIIIRFSTLQSVVRRSEENNLVTMDNRKIASTESLMRFAYDIAVERHEEQKKSKNTPKKSKKKSKSKLEKVDH